jgi:hypothetical protein
MIYYCGKSKEYSRIKKKYYIIFALYNCVTLLRNKWEEDRMIVAWRVISMEEFREWVPFYHPFISHLPEVI